MYNCLKHCSIWCYRALYMYIYTCRRNSMFSVELHVYHWCDIKYILIEIKRYTECWYLNRITRKSLSTYVFSLWLHHNVSRHKWSTPFTSLSRFPRSSIKLYRSYMQVYQKKYNDKACFYANSPLYFLHCDSKFMSFQACLSAGIVCICCIVYIHAWHWCSKIETRFLQK